MDNRIQQYTRLNLLVGAIAWLFLWVFSLNQWSYLSQIHLLIVFGIAILTPMSLRLVITIERDGKIPLLGRVILRIQPLIPVLSVISIVTSQDMVAGILASSWLIHSGLIALFGLLRLMGRSAHALEELCIDVGLILASVSGIWFFFYRLSGSFFGFTGVLVPLTAAHFVTIGMGALIIAGMIGRQVRTQSDLSLVYRAIAWITIISPMVVAAGITLTNVMGDVSPVEVAGVILLSTSFVSLAGYYLVRVRPTINILKARWSLNLSAMILFFTMLLALGYSLGRFTGFFAFSIPDMVQWHGWLNALGFAGFGVLGWTFVAPPAFAQPIE